MLPLKKQLNAKDSGTVIILNYIIMLVAQVVVIILFSGINALLIGTTNTSLPDKALWFLFIVNQIVFILVTSAYVKSKGIRPIKIAGLRRKLTGKQIIMLVVITVLLFIASAPIAILFSFIIRGLGAESVADIPALDSLSAILLAIFVMAIMPALGEEFLFRNTVLRGLKRRGYFAAAVLTSILFSLMHGNIDQLIHQFFVGMTLAFVMHVTNTLWAPIIVHFTNNFIAIGLNFVITDDLLLGINETLFVIIILVMIFIGAILMVMALKYFISLEKDKRKGVRGIDINIEKESFILNFFKTAISIAKHITSKKKRKSLYLRYNNLMSEFDYDKQEIIENTSMDNDIMEIIEKRNNDLVVVKLAMLGMGFIVFMSFIATLLVGILS